MKAMEENDILRAQRAWYCCAMIKEKGKRDDESRDESKKSEAGREGWAASPAGDAQITLTKNREASPTPPVGARRGPKLIALASISPALNRLP